MKQARNIRPRPLEVGIALPINFLADGNEKEGANDLAAKNGGDSFQRKILNIPIPIFNDDITYQSVQQPEFVLPTCYIFPPHTSKRRDREYDYLVDAEDHDWLAHHSRFTTDKDLSQLVSLALLERMFNIFESETAYDSVISNAKAEAAVSQAINERYLEYTSAYSSHRLPSLNSVSWRQIKTRLVTDIYNHWTSRRSKLKKPLDRKYWGATPTTDMSPYNVFRPREKEGYKLRRHRRNDMESYRKLDMLRRDMRKLEICLQLIVDREGLKCHLIKLKQMEYYDLMCECVVDGDKVPESVVDMRSQLVAAKKSNQYNSAYQMRFPDALTFPAIKLSRFSMISDDDFDSEGGNARNDDDPLKARMNATNDVYGLKNKKTRWRHGRKSALQVQAESSSVVPAEGHPPSSISSEAAKKIGGRSRRHAGHFATGAQVGTGHHHHHHTHSTTTHSTYQLPGFASTLAVEGSDDRRHIVELPGSVRVLRPTWGSFLPNGSIVRTESSVGIIGGNNDFCCPVDWSDYCKRLNLTLDDNNEEEEEEEQLVGFTPWLRRGRGGRVMIDRISVTSSRRRRGRGKGGRRTGVNRLADLTDNLNNSCDDDDEDESSWISSVVNPIISIVDNKADAKPSKHSMSKTTTPAKQQALNDVSIGVNSATLHRAMESLNASDSDEEAIGVIVELNIVKGGKRESRQFSRDIAGSKYSQIIA